MITKKLILPFLALSLLGTSVLHASGSETKDKIKVGSAVTAGLAAGAAVGTYMPGPLPAKIVAGAATSALVTPWLVFQSLRNIPPYEIDGTWKEKAKAASEVGIILGLVAAPILGLTLGIGAGKQIQADSTRKILGGSAIGAGITAVGFIPAALFAFDKFMRVVVQVSK